ncbi:MAG: LPS translocon maturation chaperone LptM, partial [Oscillospiraceae bacterium]
MNKRIPAAALALALLTGCGARAPLELPEAEADSTAVAYVPLDDRPDNVGRVVYLAESLGYTLNMPEEWTYKTLLDGQSEDYCAENGLEPMPQSFPHGSPSALYDWVLEQEAAGCDRYILSMDQMLYGGLVASRVAGTTAERNGMDRPLTDLIDGLLDALAADPGNEVWLLDSVMRLAPTVGYAGGTLE